MNEDIIIQDIKETNPWWFKEFELKEYKIREIYTRISEFMKTKQIIALTGLRRVGKTFIIYKIIEEYLKDNFIKQNIFYFSFDNYSYVKIQEVINMYKKLNEKDISSGKYLFAFDEIQKVRNWEEQLKRFYDLYPNIKFIISGSESLFIRRKSRESLAGRIFEFMVRPLNFREFLGFKGRNFSNLQFHKEEILKEFNNFLLSNGFPELINSPYEEAKKYIQEGIIDRVLYRDMAEVFNIRNTTLLKSIFDIIYNDPGQLIELQGLSKEIGISRQALSEYLEYLEESYLIKKLYNFSRNARKTQRRLKKYYSSIINPALIKDNFSKVFEQVNVIQLDAEFFWRDTYKNEVDIIKTDPLIAIEIKSGEVREKDISSLQKFKEKFKPKKAVVLSYNIEKEMREIKVIPFYKYLLAD